MMDWLPWIPTLDKKQYISAGVVKESDEENCSTDGPFQAKVITTKCVF